MRSALSSTAEEAVMLDCGCETAIAYSAADMSRAGNGRPGTWMRRFATDWPVVFWLAQAHRTSKFPYLFLGIQLKAKPSPPAAHRLHHRRQPLPEPRTSPSTAQFREQAHP